MSLLGLALGLGLVLGGQLLEGGSLRSILQPTAAVIVFGGTFGAVFVSFSQRDLQRTVRSVPRVFVEREVPIEETITTLTRFAAKARKDGIMSLEDDVERLPDPFMRRGLGLAVDAISPNTLRGMLECESVSREELEEVPARVFEAAGGYAPRSASWGPCWASST